MQTYSKQQALDKIKELVKTFAQNEGQLQNKAEAQIEQNYIRPLFSALNWNTENEGLAPADWEFVLQDTDRRGKRPDYRLQLDGQHLLLMDAKMVKYSMHDAQWQWQVYKYAYSTRNNPTPRKVDFGILTDFQEFILLDCTFEAKEPEAVNNFRVLDWRYTDYVTQFDRLWELFERNNMLEASRDRKSGLWACYLSPKQAKANRVPPDEGFLDKLDNDKTGWRVRLAKDMKKCTPSLTGEVITGAVQLLIDRLVFIKAITDRDIDDDYLAKLAECIEASGLDEDDRGWFTAAKPLFDRLNRFYNGSMFAPQPELEAVVTSNRLLRDIIRELDPNHSPYDLAVLPVEILGTIYERFLGKVVRATDQRVKIEEKPEVRKAGGVYYTPQYIVRYIVEHTVGKLLADCRLPEDVAKLKILDPACGSGSFLLGAYDALIAWHKSYYSARAKPAREAAYRDANGDIRLTAKLKRQILLNNLFGVDIDQQAVEVTRFSLSLKALEETRKAELDEERNLFKETVLPDLRDNIKCGNSLIASDFSLVPDDLLRVHAFDWAVQFQAIIKAGGFDAVIGNPPYIQLSMQEFRDDQVNTYLKERFRMSGGRLNTFILFLEKARCLTRIGGKFGFIVPNTLLTQEYYEEARLRLLQNTRIESLVSPKEAVFSDAVVENIILIAQPTSRPAKNAAFECVFANLSEPGLDAVRKVRQKEFATNFRTSFVAPADPGLSALRTKLNVLPVKFGMLLNINQAIALKHDRAACLTDKPTSPQHHEILDGRHIGRYFTGDSPNYFKFDIAKIHSCKREDIFLASEKILMRRVGDRLIGTLDTKQKFALNTLVVMTPRDECDYSLKFILGIFNSMLMNFFYTRFLKSTKKVFSEIQARQVAQLPVPKVDLKNLADNARHDRLVAQVDTMLTLAPRLRAAHNEAERTTLNNAVIATDRQIDALVYELYGLTHEEIRLVESVQ